MRKLIYATALGLALALPAGGAALAQSDMNRDMTSPMPSNSETTTGTTGATGMTGSSGMTDTTGSTTAQRFDPATVRAIEQALNDRGYDVGEVDGVLDQQAFASIENFQRTEGIEATGVPNSDTLDALGVDAAAGAQDSTGTWEPMEPGTGQDSSMDDTMGQPN